MYCIARAHGIEIKRIDAGLKTLVQNNFYKFVIAGDTLTSMHSSLDALDARMVALTDRLETSAALNDTVNEQLSTKRSQISQLSEVQALMDHLHALALAPTKLKDAQKHSVTSFSVSDDPSYLAYARALSYYSSVKPILEQCQHIPTFLTLFETAERSVHDIHASLSAAFTDPKVAIYCSISCCSQRVDCTGHVEFAIGVANASW